MAMDSQNTNSLTAEQVDATLIQPLEQASVFLSAPGIKVIESAGALLMPSLVTGSSPSWYGQNEQIAESDPTFGELELMPSTMKSVKVLSKFSNELARQSVVALDVAISDRLVADCTNVIDAQLLGKGGDGTTTPQGIFGWAGVQEIKVAGALTLDHLIDADGLAMTANADATKLTVVMNPREFTNLRKVKATDGNYLVQPDATQPGSYVLFGHKVIVSNHVPAGSVALVDFSQVVVARDASPSVKVLDQTFGDFDAVAVRATARYDAKPANPKAVIKLTGIAWA